VGYYHYNYSADQLEHMVDETRRTEGDTLWAKVLGYYVDKRKYLEGEMKKYADPPSDKLLPDLPPHAHHVRTLVLDLDNVLIHSDWTRGRGWRTFKRPGAEEFIKDLSQYYELVVYTSQLPTYADPIMDRLDPQRLVQYRLYRDSTRYVDGRHVRDLSKLNRDLNQVLLVTADTDAYALQPDNAIKLPKWTTAEGGGDTTLLDLLPFLEAIVRTNVPDVKAVVKSYDGQDIPTAFRERMARVQEAKMKREGGRKGWLGK
jgi:import inner membrane translocase subunit TIM50